LEQTLKLGVADFKLFWRWKSWLFGWLLKNIAAAMGFILIARVAGRPDELVNLAAGYTVYSACAATLWVVSASTWVRSEGMLLPLLSARKGLYYCSFGRGFVWLLNGIVTAACVWIFFNFYIEPQLDALQALLLLVLVSAAALSAYAFGLILGVFALFYPRIRNILVSVAGTAIFAFCGASVPVAFWGPIIQHGAKLLPAYHSIAGVRSLLAGRYDWFDYAAQELVAFAFWMVLYFLISRWLEGKARSMSDLEIA
jgi:ABC-2 type transport system permease protein